jgi:NAD(P)-dependent dehydrogenase (short-subunit alcohol dehydrogenase family)
MTGSPHVRALFDLTGQVALVTGGARNPGFDMALALAEPGADVAITSRELGNAEAAAGKIAADTGRRVLPLGLDVADEEQVKAVVDACLAEFGRIDILVNNAGNVLSTPETAQIEDRPYSDWLNTLSINLNGTFLCSKYVTARAMIPAGKGNIINIGSIAGIVGRDRRVYEGTDMGGSTVDYEAAKGAVIAMTRDMAVYLARYNIRVNCISPGGFFRNQPEAFVKAYSESTPMGRMGMDGKEMKGPVVFLASEASSYCTGHNLVIDGGFTVW